MVDLPRSLPELSGEQDGEAVSAAGRGAIRVEHDFYATPEWCTKLIIEHIDFSKVDSVMEPCRGDGAITDCLEDFPLRISYAEIRDGLDYFAMLSPEVDLTLTNPPYNIATEFLKKALAHSKCVSFLLRINYLGSAKRKEFLSANRPTHLYTLTERPSFVDVCAGFEKPEKKKGCGACFHKDALIKICPDCGGKVKAGTDATEYAWICWDKENIMRDAPGIYFL